MSNLKELEAMLEEDALDFKALEDLLNSKSVTYSDMQHRCPAG